MGFRLRSRRAIEWELLARVAAGKAPSRDSWRGSGTRKRDKFTLKERRYRIIRCPLYGGRSAACRRTRYCFPVHCGRTWSWETSPAVHRTIEKVVATVRLEEVLRQLPRGLDTNLGAGLQGLSGGERQRVALARALLRRAAVLVMDESTSALDPLTEAAVLRDLEKLCPQTTLVVISHRLEAIPWLRRSLVVERGKVINTTKPAEERTA